MNYTVVGLFEDKNDANKAAEKLKNNGYNDGQIDVSLYRTEGEYKEKDYHYDEDEKTSGFWDWLFGEDADEKERHSRVGSRTNVLTVLVDDKASAERCVSMLDECGAVDIDDYDRKLQEGGYNNTATNLDNRNNDGVIEVVEENVAVGKRDVDSGGVRIKSRIVEKAVEEDVRLREERVYVTRKPVDREVSSGAAFQGEKIEMSATSEEAVVEKTARVVEEISLDKDVDHHTETIHETVRETKVDIDKDRDRNA